MRMSSTFPLPHSPRFHAKKLFRITQEFLLVRFMEPLLVLSRETEDGRFVLVDEEEDEVSGVAMGLPIAFIGGRVVAPFSGGGRTGV